MKHDAIVEQGIPIHERVPIPEELIPEDSRVEIDAKIHAGYCRYRLMITFCSVLDTGVAMARFRYCITGGIYMGPTDVNPVTTGKVMNMMELSEVQGRPWDDVDVRPLKSLMDLDEPNSLLTYSPALSERNEGPERWWC